MLWCNKFLSACRSSCFPIIVNRVCRQVLNTYSFAVVSMLKFSLFALVEAWVWLASELIRTLNTARICLCDDILIFNFDATCTVSSTCLATKCSLSTRSWFACCSVFWQAWAVAHHGLIFGFTLEKLTLTRAWRRIDRCQHRIFYRAASQHNNENSFSSFCNLLPKDLKRNMTIFTTTPRIIPTHHTP